MTLGAEGLTFDAVFFIIGEACCIAQGLLKRKGVKKMMICICTRMLKGAGKVLAVQCFRPPASSLTVLCR